MQDKLQKSKQKKVETKGVRISLRIGQHDLDIKAKQAAKFLEKGHKVKVDIILKGREKKLFELAKEKTEQFIQSVSPEAKIEGGFKKGPKGISVLISK